METEIVASIETRFGDLEITKTGDRYSLSVGGVMRHPNGDAQAMIHALAHYLHGAEYTLMKYKATESKA